MKPLLIFLIWNHKRADVDYPFWHEVGIVSIMAIIVMILFRDKL